MLMISSIPICSSSFSYSVVFSPPWWYHKKAACKAYYALHTAKYYIWCWGQKVFCPQWYRIASCFALSQSSKTFIIRSFFYEKWLLIHVFGGSQGQKSSCKQACIRFLTFWPWYHDMYNNMIRYIKTQAFFKTTDRSTLITDS